MTQPNYSSPDDVMASGRAYDPTDNRFRLSLNVVFPLIGDRFTWSHEHLLPIFVSLIVALMLSAVPLPWMQLTMDGKPAPSGINEAWQVFTILGVYIAFIINYFINQMSGRARSGVHQALISLIMFWLLTGRLWDYWYDFFYSVIPAGRWEESSNPLAVIASNIFGTGLAEEGFKALPLLALALISAAVTHLACRTGGSLRALLTGFTEHFGLREPLEGIVLGAASGSGFFIYETLVEYVPRVFHHTQDPAASAFDGLVLLLARGLPELTAHAAYSGLFGYFIGLSVLRPAMAVFLIPLGWLTAAALHGAWDATNDLVSSPWIGVPVHVLIGVLSYGLLAGAIFKAREISPGFAARCPKMRGTGYIDPAYLPLSETEALDSRVTCELKAALEEAARDNRHSVAGLVQKVLADWLIGKGYLKHRW